MIIQLGQYRGRFVDSASMPDDRYSRRLGTKGPVSLDISSASFAYPQHDGALRAKLAERLMGTTPPEQGFLLSTCLRVEVTIPGPRAQLDHSLLQMFGDLVETAEPQVRLGERAVTHLYRVAAGLESPILGEQEILTQFRQALIEAEEEERVDGLLARLLETAVSVGRQARDLLPGSPHNSMAAIAAQTVGTAKQAAVLGSGLMATAVVDALLLLPAPPDVTVVARHPEKVGVRDGVEVAPFSEATRILSTCPAVVSATSAKHRLVDDQALAEVVDQRREPLLLIDMAMPPDFRPSVSANVTYLDIDDLARLADRRSRSQEADLLVEGAAADAYRQYRDHHEIGPLIGGLMGVADEVVNGVVRRFANRLGGGDDEAVLRQAAHTVARTLLSGPISYLKQKDRSVEGSEVIADAFGVADE